MKIFQKNQGLLKAGFWETLRLDSGMLKAAPFLLTDSLGLAHPGILAALQMAQGSLQFFFFCLAIWGIGFLEMESRRAQACCFSRKLHPGILEATRSIYIGLLKSVIWWENGNLELCIHPEQHDMLNAWGWEQSRNSCISFTCACSDQLLRQSETKNAAMFGVVPLTDYIYIHVLPTLVAHYVNI